MESKLSTFALAVSAVVLGWFLNSYRDRNRTLGKVIFRITLIVDEMRIINSHMNFLVANLKDFDNLSNFKRIEELRFGFSGALNKLKYEESVILELAAVDPFSAYILEGAIKSYNETMDVLQSTHNEIVTSGKIDEVTYYRMLWSAEERKQRCFNQVSRILTRLTFRYGMLTFIKFKFLIIRHDRKEKDFLHIIQGHLERLEDLENIAEEALVKHK